MQKDDPARRSARLATGSEDLYEFLSWAIEQDQLYDSPVKRLEEYIARANVTLFKDER